MDESSSWNFQESTAAEILSLACRIGFSIGQRGNLGRFEVSRHFAQAQGTATAFLEQSPGLHGPSPRFRRPQGESETELNPGSYSQGIGGDLREFGIF